MTIRGWPGTERTADLRRRGETAEPAADSASENSSGRTDSSRAQPPRYGLDVHGSPLAPDYTSDLLVYKTTLYET